MFKCFADIPVSFLPLFLLPHFSLWYFFIGKFYGYILDKYSFCLIRVSMSSFFIYLFIYLFFFFFFCKYLFAITPWEFFIPAFASGLSDSNYFQVSRILFRIQTDLLPLISNSSPGLWGPFQAHQLQLVSLSPSCSTDFFSSLAWSKNFSIFSLSLVFTLSSAEMVKTICISKSLGNICVKFTKTDFSTYTIFRYFKFQSFALFTDDHFPQPCRLSFFHSIWILFISFSWWYFTWVWVTASLLRSPGLFSVFWLILTMLYFPCSLSVLRFLTLSVLFPIIWRPFQVRQSPPCSMILSVF